MIFKNAWIGRSDGASAVCADYASVTNDCISN